MLTGRVLCVVNEFSSVTRLLIRHGGGRQPRNNDHWNASSCGVVHTAAQVLCANVHMDQDHLRFARDHGVTMSSAQGGHFVGADDDGWAVLALGMQGCKGFNERRVIAAQIGENVFNAQLRRIF